MLISRSVLLIMRNISDKSCRKKNNLCSVTFFFRKPCRLWDIVEKWCRVGRPQVTIWRLRVACWITKAADTHSEYVILIAFPLQQLYEWALMLRYTRFVSFYVVSFPRLFDGNVIMFSAVHLTLWLFFAVKLWCLVVLCPKGVCKERSSMYIGSCERDLSWYAARYLII